MNDFVNKLAKMVGFIAVGLFQLLYLKKKNPRRCTQSSWEILNCRRTHTNFFIV